jgi:cytochrome c-type protein NapC
MGAGLSSMTDTDFFTWIGAAAAGAMILLGLVVLLLPLPLPQTDWLRGTLLGVLGLLPVFVILFGTGVSYQKSKSVNFCASCHIMDSRIRDMKDPQSESLAALHYKNRYILENQCFTCHTGYALFGDEKAKMVGLKHVYDMYTKTIKEPLQLYQPYDTANCLHCHGESQKFLGAPTHQDIMADLKSGALSCLECHGPAHNVGNPEGTP